MEGDGEQVERVVVTESGYCYHARHWAWESLQGCVVSACGTIKGLGDDGRSAVELVPISEVEDDRLPCMHCYPDRREEEIEDR